MINQAAVGLILMIGSLTIIIGMIAHGVRAHNDRDRILAEVNEAEACHQAVPALEHEALAPRSVEAWDHPETCEQCHPRLEQVVAYLNNGHTAGSVLTSGARQVGESLEGFGRRAAVMHYGTPITVALASEMRALHAELEQDKERLAWEKRREDALSESLAALVRTHGQIDHIMEFGQNKPIRLFRQAL